MNTTLIGLIITAIVAPLLFWILNKKGRRIENTEKLVNMLQKEVDRLSERIASMEKRLENKDGIIERKNYAIQAAFECRTPSQRCPVLQANSKIFNIKNIENDNQQRPTEQQSGQHPSEQDGI